MYSRMGDKLSKGSSENWDPFIYLSFKITTYLYTSISGAVARSEACSLGMQATPSSIPTSGTFFRGNISTAILPLPLIQEEQLSVTGEGMCTKYW